MQDVTLRIQHEEDTKRRLDIYSVEALHSKSKFINEKFLGSNALAKELMCLSDVSDKYYETERKKAQARNQVSAQ